MKVLNIEPYRGNDGSDKWNITLQGTNMPLITDKPPDFEIGFDIPQDKLETRQSRRGAFFIFKAEAKTESTEKDNSIRGQTAMKIISDIYCAGMIEDFQSSDNPFIINLRDWVNSALIKDPLIGEILNAGNS